jgi:hypothetical protein
MTPPPPDLLALAKALEHRCVMGLYHKAGDEVGAIAFVKRLEFEGWKVLHISPDEHTGWTKVALVRDQPLPATHDRGTPAAGDDATVERVAEIEARAAAAAEDWDHSMSRSAWHLIDKDIPWLIDKLQAALLAVKP